LKTSHTIKLNPTHFFDASIFFKKKKRFEQTLIKTRFEQALRKTRKSRGVYFLSYPPPGGGRNDLTI